MYSLIEPVQCRMARAGLGIGVRDLAGMAKVSPNTVARFERGDVLRPETITLLASALETAGVTFLSRDANGLGLRVRSAGAFMAGGEEG